MSQLELTKSKLSAEYQIQHKTLEFIETLIQPGMTAMEVAKIAQQVHIAAISCLRDLESDGDEDFGPASVLRGKMMGNRLRVK